MKFLEQLSFFFLWVGEAPPRALGSIPEHGRADANQDFRALIGRLMDVLGGSVKLQHPHYIPLTLKEANIVVSCFF